MPDTPSPRDQQIEEVGNDIGSRLSTAVVLFHSAIADRLGLNVTDWKCADIIRRYPSMNPGQLSEITGMTTPATTLALDRLEKAGLIRRERDTQDRRKVIIYPVNNPERNQEIGALFTGLIEAMNDVMARYDDAQLVTISDFVERTITAVEVAAVELRKDSADS